ncbi:hypothetical protein TFLX_04622 [Thermoflexales bacterium]|nr:hypothetical protein TFLX_04622 [Thermoflexales bacterium]
MGSPVKSRREFEAQLHELQLRLSEAEETLRAIRQGEVDALLVNTAHGDEIYTLQGADYPYRLLIQEMSEGAVTVQQDGTILYCNQRFADLLHRPIEQVFSSNLADYVSADERSVLTALLQQVGRGEVLVQTAQGALVPVHISSAALQFDGMKALALLVTDLTIQKRQQDLIAAERLARSILDQAAEGIIVCDLQGRIIQANQTARALSAANPLQQPFDRVYPLYQINQSGAPAPLPVTRLLNGEIVRSLEVGLACSDDPTLQTFLISVAPLSETSQASTSGYVVTLINVSERKRMEQALRLSEERFRLALKNSPVAVFNQDRELRYTWVYPPEYGESLGKTDAELLNNSEASLLTGWKRFVLKTGQVVRSEIELTRRGETFYYDLLIEPLYDARGQITGVSSATIDITDRRLAEEARLHSEERFRHLFDFSPIALCELDCAAAQAQLQDWRLAGTQDFRQHFAQQPQAVVQCAQLLKIIGFNQAALELYGARNKDQFSLPLNPARFIPLPMLGEILSLLVEGRTSHESETVLHTVDGDEKKVLLRMRLVPDQMQQLSRMLISWVDLAQHPRGADVALPAQD